MTESSEWVAWVGPAREGDVDAIDKLSQHFSPFIHAVLVSRLSHRTAATLVRPVIAEAMSRIGSVTHDAAFATAVLAVAREKAFEASKVPGSTLDVAGDDPLVNNGHLVLSKIRQLSETARERLVMRLLEGIAGFEIAQVVGGKEADVRSELERSAATLVQQLTEQEVSFTADTYLWSLAGTPHPALIPLENQLTSLRYDSTFDPELTPAKLPALIIPKVGPEGRRQTSAALKPVNESTGVGHRALKDPAVASDPANPFGTSVKTIHVSDLPAAADFADLQGTRPEASEPLEDEEASTQIQSVEEISVRTREARTRAAKDDVDSPTQVRPSGSKARGKSLVDHEEPGEDTNVLPHAPGGWRVSGLVGNPAPMKTIMGLPAVIVARGSVMRSWRPFGIGGVFALIAVGVALLLFDGTNRRIHAGWNLVPVVVAATDLTQGTVITIEMISQRSVPEGFVTASVIKPDSTSYVVNQKILVDAQAGDPLLWSQFEVARSNERLSKKVMRRARAYDLMTSKSIAVGGWVQPADRIDIIASLKAREKGGARVAVTLLQDIPVLSTGKITTSTPNSAKRDGDRDYIDVSVLLLPEEAELLALANEEGDLQFTLRTEDDHDTLSDHRGTNSKTLLQGERVRLLQLKRMKTIQQIRNTRPP